MLPTRLSARPRSGYSRSHRVQIVQYVLIVRAETQRRLQLGDRLVVASLHGERPPDETIGDALVDERVPQQPSRAVFRGKHRQDQAVLSDRLGPFLLDRVRVSD